MTREKALEAMDRLVAMGYTATMTERDMGAHGHVMIGPDGATSIARSLSVVELSVDKVDLKALVAVADELGLDVGMHGIRPGELVFSVEATPEETRKREVVHGRRRRPR